MFLGLAVLFAMGVAGGPGVSPPDVKYFKQVLSKELEFRIDDYKTALVGRVVVYQNPNDKNEFVRVYYRQVAIISERAQEKDSTEAGNQDTNLSNFKYHSKEEKETLGRVQQATDAFAFVQWHTVRDPRTGQDIRDGVSQSWLLGQNGTWVFSSSYNLLSSPFSEPSKDDPKKIIIIGIKFTLADRAHIVRIDQDDVMNLVKEVTSEKK